MYKSRPTPACFLSLLIYVLILTPLANAEEKTFDLNVSISKSQQSRVSANVKHVGDVVVLTEKKDDPIKFLPLNVAGKINYFQRSTGKNQVLRYYENAKATIKLEKGKSEPVLGPKNRMIIARIKPGAAKQIEMASILDTLTSKELELIDLIADPITIGGLVNKENVKQGDRWSPDDAALAKFLDVRTVTKSKVELLAKKIDSKSARIYIRGNAEAKVDDVETKMALSGILLIDMESNTLSSMKVSVQEERGPGQIAPGFEGKTQIDLRQSSNANSPFLTDEALAKLSRAGRVQQRLAWRSKSGSFDFKYDPNWKMIASEDDTALLRLVDQGRLLAQCNVVLLPKRPANKPLSLKDYKAQVRRIADGDKTAKLEKAFERTTPSGNKAICVIVSGVEEEVPVQWNYYHIGSPDGRQVTCVFTQESKVSDRVAIHANRIVDEFKFGPMPNKVARKKSVPQTSLRK